MKCIGITLLIFGLSFSVFSQRRMVFHKHDGTRDYYLLSAVDSLTFYDTLMVPIAGGTFTAGTTPVTISSFFIDKYEVTFELWTEVRDRALTHGYADADIELGRNGFNPI